MTAAALRLRPAAPTPRARDARSALPLAAAVFLISLIVPLILQAGPLRLSAYRLVLLATVLPALALWLTGRAGRWRVTDFCVLGIAGWSTLSFFTVHGGSIAVEASGILFVETCGAYFLARSFIRMAETFRAMVRVLFLIVLFLLPAALFEALTARNIMLDAFGALGPVFHDVPKAPRWGLDRVQGPFEHPILFGVFCGSALGLAFYVLGDGRRITGRLWRAGSVFLTAALALSSGPLVALISQALLIGWDRAFRPIRLRWRALAGLAALAYLAVDLMSNRTPFHVLASYFAFSENTAYNRIRIWEWGTRSIFEHPLFGIGLTEWDRPWFMTDSVDMFWILPAMQHGIPVWALYFLAFFSMMAAVARARGGEPRLADYRTGYLITMAGIFVVGWTVHFWNATFVLFLFLLGCGAALSEAPDRAPTARRPRPKRSLL